MDTILNILHSSFSWIVTFEQSNLVFVLKILSVLISVALIVVIVKLAIKANVVKTQILKYQTFWEATKYEKKQTLRIWKKIIKLLKMHEENCRKEAILLADKLLQEMLERAGWVGSDLDEILSKMSGAQLPNREKIIANRAIVKKIASDPSLRLSHNEAVQILLVYEKTFRDFGLIED